MVLRCSRRTLERRYARTIEAGWNKGRTSLRHKQFQIAMKGDKTMLIWLGKQRLGQTEKFNVTPSQFGDLLNEMKRMLEQFVSDAELRKRIVTEWVKIPQRVVEC